MTEHLNTLPIETLRSLATLTGELRARQHLRALPTAMLRELLLECERKQNVRFAGMVRAELATR